MSACHLPVETVEPVSIYSTASPVSPFEFTGTTCLDDVDVCITTRPCRNFISCSNTYGRPVGGYFCFCILGEIDWMLQRCYSDTIVVKLWENFGIYIYSLLQSLCVIISLPSTPSTYVILLVLPLAYVCPYNNSVCTHTLLSI